MTVVDEEINILLNDLLEVYGYDFNFYTRASLKRRVNRLFTIDKFRNFQEFRDRIKSDTNYIKRFIEEITVNVTEMFRDSSFYRELRNVVMPVLGTHPFIRVWHAGCSTGEEVYSVAILLKEAGLLQKSLIYATDINPGVLEKAKSGIFPISNMKHYSENYIASGGLNDFSAYYTANYEGARFSQELRSKMIFATHNLVSDHSFNEFHLIVCRNVLIYFDRQLQERVLGLFDSSLSKLGYLAFGSKETLKFSDLQKKYTQVGKEKIWRKTS
jgi:chemotaxis protein methyltransferase CheR